MKISHFITIFAASALIAGCSSNKGAIHSDFGNAVESNMAVHIINPRVGGATTPAPEMSGRRGGVAVEKYMEGKVEKLNTESTSGKQSTAK